MSEVEEGAVALARERAISAARAAMNLEDHDMLVKTHTMVATMHAKLMGNGRPGLLADVTRLEAETLAIQRDVERIDNEVTQVKNTVPTNAEKRTAIGSAVGVVAILSAILAKLFGLPSPV